MWFELGTWKISVYLPSSFSSYLSFACGRIYIRALPSSFSLQVSTQTYSLKCHKVVGSDFVGSITHKILFAFFKTKYKIVNSKLHKKFIWKGKRYRIVNTILKENKVRRLTPPNFNAFYKLNNLKQYGCFKRRQIDQWVKIKSPETDPSKCSQFTLTK